MASAETATGSSPRPRSRSGRATATAVLPTPVGPKIAMTSTVAFSPAMDLSGRTVLLTGATGGIGHAIARALHARGARLVVTGRRRDVLEPLATEIGGTALAADLSQRLDVDRLIQE